MTVVLGFAVATYTTLLHFLSPRGGQVSLQIGLTAHHLNIFVLESFIVEYCSIQNERNLKSSSADYRLNAYRLTEHLLTSKFKHV